VKILIISDAWHPQINGVVRTLEMTVKELARLGHETRIVGPEEGKSFTFAMPFYPEIKLEFLAHRRLWRVLREFQPDFIHITTEGPLGWAARRVCLHRNLSFSTAYHTRFPEYLAARTPRVLALMFAVKRESAVERRLGRDSRRQKEAWLRKAGSGARDDG
jgi:glycosyltransferase involved in cell wall biosynthesis